MIKVTADIAGREMVLNVISQYDENTFVDLIMNNPFEFYILSLDIMEGAERPIEFFTASEVMEIQEFIARGWRDGCQREILRSLTKLIS